MISLVRDCYKTVSERYMLDVDEDLINSVNERVNERLMDPENGAITFSGDDIVAIWKEEWDSSTKRPFKFWWNSTKTDMMYPEEVAYEYLNEAMWDSYWDTFDESIDDTDDFTLEN